MGESEVGILGFYGRAVSDVGESAGHRQGGRDS